MNTTIPVLITNARQVRSGGRDFLVANLTMMVPGVIVGSSGTVLYEIEDMRKTAHAWNGIPIVKNHPQIREHYVSGKDPDVFDATGLGAIANTRVTDRLIAEGWFDVERTERVDMRILNALRFGQHLELSTGLNCDLEPRFGIANDGRQFTAVVRNYRPDHLAILPDSRGACSRDHGCGVHAGGQR